MSYLLAYKSRPDSLHVGQSSLGLYSPHPLSRASSALSSTLVGVPLLVSHRLVITTFLFLELIGEDWLRTSGQEVVEGVSWGYAVRAWGVGGRSGGGLETRVGDDENERRVRQSLMLCLNEIATMAVHFECSMVDSPISQV